MTFEEWFDKEYKAQPQECLWVKFDLGDLKAAYESGYKEGFKDGKDQGDHEV